MGTFDKYRQRFYIPSLLLLLTAILIVGFSPPTQAAGGLFSSVTPLTEPTPAAGDYFGESDYSTVISADGLTVLVAAVNATVGTTTDSGKAYIYHFVNGAWTLVKEIDDPDAAAGNNYDRFGDGLALNADGTVALIGSNATASGQSGAGKAYVFTLTNGTWTQSHEIDDPAASADDFFGGTWVALSDNGQTAVIGADGTKVNSQNFAGETYIYSESNGTWSQVAAIPDPDNGASQDGFGFPVSISGDGKSVLIGSEAPVNSQAGAGKAYLYTLTNGTWTQSHEFDDPAASTYDYFGDCGVVLSANGQTAAIGACGTTVNGKGSAGEGYIFTESNGAWNQAAAIPDPDNSANTDAFAYPVAISEDGKSVLFGSQAMVGTTTNAGKAYLYQGQANGSWTQAKEFDDPDATAGNSDYFGDSGVALSSDGETAFISASNTKVNSLVNAGEAYIYQSPDDLSLALTASPTSVTTGQSVSLNVTVTNTDTAVIANNVIITGTLPSGLSYSSSNAAGGTCTASGQTVICTLTSLAPGMTWQPTITDSASAAGSLTANANVTSNEPDPNSTNNSASATVTASAPTTPPASSGGGGGTVGLLSLGMLCLFLLDRSRRAFGSILKMHE